MSGAARLLALWSLLAAATCGARAEGIVLALSTREVAITSTYTGAEITVFGLIERDGQTIPRAGGYDIVASVRGPMGEVVVQRKEKYGPIWLTENRRRYAKVPLFFSTLSTKPLALVTDDETRLRLKLGLEYYLPTAAPGGDEFGFRNALLRLRRDERALIDDDKAITMIRPDLFTAKINLPATAPTGLYVVDLSVLAEGVPLRTAQAGFVVRKAGFDAFVANTARQSPWAYALFTIAMAVLLGWVANAVFRKD